MGFGRRAKEKMSLGVNHCLMLYLLSCPLLVAFCQPGFLLHVYRWLMSSFLWMYSLITLLQTNGFSQKTCDDLKVAVTLDYDTKRYSKLIVKGNATERWW